MKQWNFNRNYPSVEDLYKKAKKRMPRFAFEYLEGGCNEDVNLHKNTEVLRRIELKPSYLRSYQTSDLRTELFGHVYDAPFGIAPVGLQGLMWPDAPRILAKAAYAHNIPFVLSTVTTASMEEAGKLTDGRFWFQLYHPASDRLRDDLLERAAAAGCKVLVILCDVPVFGYRPRDIRNGLAMPPRMTLNNIFQIMGRPGWAIRTLWHGQPAFATMKPYMPAKLNMKRLGQFMDKTFSGRLSEDRIKSIRDKWKGKLVLKGVATAEDAETAVRLGLDGIIVSNHGGRQLDAGEASIESLKNIATCVREKLVIMMDSGIRSGVDVARALACRADFTFLGRSFMYGVGALGRKGGDHTIALLKTQVAQVMNQLGCEKTTDLPQHLI